METPDSARPRPSALDRLDCVLVFANGESSFARITRDRALQWGGTLAQIQAARPVLDALSRALAETTGGATDEQS